MVPFRDVDIPDFIVWSTLDFEILMSPFCTPVFESLFNKSRLCIESLFYLTIGIAVIVKSEEDPPRNSQRGASHGKKQEWN